MWCVNPWSQTCAALSWRHGTSCLLLVVILCVWSQAATCTAAPNVGAATDLGTAFRQPPDANKPWAYWWWLNANVSKEYITWDLEQMKEKGLGGFLLFDVTAYGQRQVASPPRRIEFLSPAWRQLVKHAMAEAHRLGLEMSMNLSTCGGALRAPWTMGNDAPEAPPLDRNGYRGAKTHDRYAAPFRIAASLGSGAAWPRGSAKARSRQSPRRPATRSGFLTIRINGAR